MAALDEVEEVGFARFSLRRVANACGVSTAAPYKHFKNKRELIEAILRHINAEWRRRQDEALNRLAGDVRLRVLADQGGSERALEGVDSRVLRGVGHVGEGRAD